MIDAMIKSAILFALVAIAARLLQRRAASLRHLLWSFAIVGAVTIPVLSRVAPFHLAVLPSRDAATSLSSRGAPPKLDKGATSTLPVAPDELTNGASNEASPSTGAPATPSGAAPGTIPWMTGVVFLWAVGALILLIRIIVGLTVVQRIANRAEEVTDADWLNAIDRAIAALEIRVPVTVRFSDEMPMPFTCGLARPIIVLPTSANTWSPEQRDAVLLHELAHISRGDLPMNILSHVMRAMYWVNPLAWLAAHRLRAEGERACDDTVLLAGAKPSDYADYLLSIVRSIGRQVPKVALAMARSSDFEGRLLAILEPGVPRAGLGRLRAAGLAVVFLAALMPLAAMTSSPGLSPQSTPLAQDVQTTRSLNSAPLPEPSRTVAALAEAVGDANPSVRLAAVNSLASLEDPAAIAALAKALKEDTDARVREAAAWALGQIDDNRAVPHLLDALKTERVTKVREKIVEALADIKDANALPGVSAVLKDPAPEVRRAAVHALSEFEDQAAAPALVGMIRDDDLEVRRRVAEALGQLENPVAIDALTSMTRDADSEVRANAVESLHHFHDQKLLPVFVAALKDSSAHVRQHAADALGSFENLKTAPRALIEALSDPNRDVRKEAAQALANIGDEAAVPGLKNLVRDGDAGTRRTAVEALKEIGGTEAIQVLMTLLKDPDPEVRKTAAEALGKKRG